MITLVLEQMSEQSLPILVTKPNDVIMEKKLMIQRGLQIKELSATGG